MMPYSWQQVDQHLRLRADQHHAVMQPTRQQLGQEVQAWRPISQQRLQESTGPRLGRLRQATELLASLARQKLDEVIQQSPAPTSQLSDAKEYLQQPLTCGYIAKACDLISQAQEASRAAGQLDNVKGAGVMVRDLLLLMCCLERGPFDLAAFRATMEDLFSFPASRDMRHLLSKLVLAFEKMVKLGSNRQVFDQEAQRLFGDCDATALFAAYSKFAEENAAFQSKNQASGRRRRPHNRGAAEAAPAAAAAPAAGSSEGADDSESKEEEVNESESQEQEEAPQQLRAGLFDVDEESTADNPSDSGATPPPSAPAAAAGTTKPCSAGASSAALPPAPTGDGLPRHDQQRLGVQNTFLQFDMRSEQNSIGGKTFPLTASRKPLPLEWPPLLTIQHRACDNPACGREDAHGYHTRERGYLCIDCSARPSAPTAAPTPVVQEGCQYDLAEPENISGEDPLWRTHFLITRADCLAVARKECAKVARDECGKVGLLVFGIKEGPGAAHNKKGQATDVCNCSNLAQRVHGKDWVPPCRGGCYIPTVRVHATAAGACEPFDVDGMLYAAASKRVKKDGEDGFEDDKQRVCEEMEAHMQNVLRTFFKREHTTIILGAWGCGWNGLPPAKVAKLWFDCLVPKAGEGDEGEFFNRFRRVIFAITKQEDEAAFREQFAGVVDDADAASSSSSVGEAVDVVEGEGAAVDPAAEDWSAPVAGAAATYQ